MFQRIATRELPSGIFAPFKHVLLQLTEKQGAYMPQGIASAGGDCFPPGMSGCGVSGIAGADTKCAVDFRAQVVRFPAISGGSSACVADCDAVR